MSGGGGGGSTPKLIDDNLKSKQYLKVLDLLCEGPIAGPVDQQHLSSFMLNKTPVTDSAGNTTINGVSVAWRPGTASQEPINGFNTIESTTLVNADVTQATPIVRTVTDTDVDRVRMNIGVSGLVQQDTRGNQQETSVTMVIETRTGNLSWQTQKTVTIRGKISGEYLEAHLFDAPDTKPFDIRLRRITADSSSDLLNNGTVWNSFTEITDDNLSYPHSAVAGCVVDRDQYTETPTRTYHLRGLIVDVPDNYDPITRTYTGIWTGGFKSAWTNNPAWLFRALVKNPRYGLARSAGYIDVDDGSLYVLSQFCDQMVDDGYGGKEPRFTLNAYITEQKSSRDLLDDIAGMFRGIALWDGMRFSVMLDNPQDPVASITNANVVDGLFTYSSMKRSERYNAVVVSWTDPNNGWEQVKEYVSDDEMIGRHSYNETTIEAFGCTSRGQAFRAGKWMLETVKRENKKVAFKMAREAIRFIPGDIIEVMDNNHAASRLGGRIMSHAGKSITADADVSELVGSGDLVSLMSSSGKFVKYEIASVAGREITLKTAPTWVRDGTVFVISTGEAAPILVRIMGISEESNNSVYSITATLHGPKKQAVVDDGAVFDMPNDTFNSYRVPNIESLRIINTNSETVQVTATWETGTATKKLAFELYIYNADGRVVAQYETDQFRYEFYGLDSGNYSLGVRGRNENGMKGAETQVSLIIGAPSAPKSIQWLPGVFQATLVPVTQATLTSDTGFEFWFSGENPVSNIKNIESQAQYLGRGHQWTVSQLKVGHVYYIYVRARNAFGVSDFVQASGSPEADFSEITDAVVEGVKDSDVFKGIIESVIDGSAKIEDLAEAIRDNAENLASAVESTKQTTDQIIADAKDMAEDIQKNADAIADAVQSGKETTDQIIADTEKLAEDIQKNADDIINAVNSGKETTDQIIADADKMANNILQNGADITAVSAANKQTAQAIISNSLALADVVVRQSVHYGENSAKYEQLREVIATETEARVTDVINLEARTAANESGLTEVRQTLTNETEARTTAVDQLTAKTANNTADITSLNEAVTTLESSTATRFDELAVKTDTASGAIQNNAQAIISNSLAQADTSFRIAVQNGENTAKFEQVRQVIATETEARVSDIERLEAATGDNTAAINAVRQAVSDESSARVDAVEKLTVTTGENAAAITRVSQAITDETEARTSAVEKLTAETEKANASVSGLAETVATLDGATSTRFDEITAKTEQASGAIQNNAQAIISNSLAQADISTRLSVQSGDNAAKFERVTQVIATETEARVSDVERLEAVTGDNTAAINSVRQAVSDETSARIDAIEKLTVSSESNAAAITRVNQAITDETLARTSAVEQLTTKTDQTNASVSNLAETVATLDGATSTRFDEMEVKAGQVSGAIQNNAQAIISNSLAQADISTRLSVQSGDNSAKFEQVTQVIASETEARVNDVTRLEAQTGKNTAGLTDLSQVVADEKAASATRMTTIETRTGKNESAITNVNTALTNETEARTQAVNQLNTRVDDNESDVSELTQAVTTLDSAMASRLEELKAQTDNASGSSKNNAIALITNTLAQVNMRQTLSVQYNANQAEIDRIDTVIADEKSATATALEQIKTDVAGNAASVTNLSQTVSNYQQATATQISTITASVNDNTALISDTSKAVADINGELSASRVIKVAVDDNGRSVVSGIGFGVNNDSGVTQSEIIMMADQLFFTSQVNGALTSPFIIKNNQVIINDLLVGDGSITNAKIGNLIQSNNYAPSFSGWSINKDGGSEFNDVVVRGKVYATDGVFRGTVYATDGRFEGTVYAEKIEGDVVSTHVVNRGETITIPASAVKRTLVIPTIMASGDVSSDFGTKFFTRCIVTINGTRAVDIRADGAQTRATAYSRVIEANTVTTIQYEADGNTGGGYMPFLACILMKS